jgi:hypothetical protein
MIRLRQPIPLPWLAALIAASTLPALASAQNDGFNFAVHANSRVTADQLGLPVFPGAVLNKHGHDDASFDLGLTLGSKSFRLRGVSYVTGASPANVLDFYRGALKHYGEVLECDHGRPVGSVTRTREGLTCDSKPGNHLHVDGGDSEGPEHDLRAGSPQRFRLAGVETADKSPTKFVLLLVEIPEHQD